MTATLEYYNRRWDAENTAELPPAPGRVSLVTETTASLLASIHNPRILDVGCGNGWILSAIDERLQGRGQLHGIEPSPRGTQNSSKRVPTAIIQTGTLADTPFDGQFDLVVTSEVIEHVPDKKEFISQIATVLKPEGSLVLTTPNGIYREHYFQDHPEIELQPVEDWVTTLELQALCKSNFTQRWSHTFGTEYFFSRHQWASSARRRIQAYRGGRRIRSRMDRFISRTLGRGLNILAVFDKCHTNES